MRFAEGFVDILTLMVAIEMIVFKNGEVFLCSLIVQSQIKDTMNFRSLLCFSDQKEDRLKG